MIDIEKEYLDEIRQVLHDQIPELEVRVFGSRIRGRASKYSDIDIAIKGAKPLENSRFSHLLETFADSDLPIKVDIVDCNVISDAFNKIINEHNVPLLCGNGTAK